MGLGLSLTKDVVTEIKPDSQAAREGRIKVGDRVVSVNGAAPTAAKPASTLLQSIGHGAAVTLELSRAAPQDAPASAGYHPSPQPQPAASQEPSGSSSSSSSLRSGGQDLSDRKGTGCSLRSDQDQVAAREGSEPERSGRRVSVSPTRPRERGDNQRARERGDNQRARDGLRASLTGMPCPL